MKAHAAALVVAVVTFSSPVLGADDAYPSLDGPGLAQGRSVWLNTCRACHGEGFADAPAVSDRTAWAPRVAKGKPALYKHALEGFFGPMSSMMPPRGGNPLLSDEEVRLAVDYMVALVTRTP